MPSVSPAQHRLMEAVAHGWKPGGKAKGLTPAVAQEFVAADKGKTFGRIGSGKKHPSKSRHA